MRRASSPRPSRLFRAAMLLDQGELYAPYHLKGTTWDEQRDVFGDTVVNTLR